MLILSLGTYKWPLLLAGSRRICVGESEALLKTDPAYFLCFLGASVQVISSHDLSSMCRFFLNNFFAAFVFFFLPCAKTHLKCHLLWEASSAWLRVELKILFLGSNAMALTMLYHNIRHLSVYSACRWVLQNQSLCSGSPFKVSAWGILDT